MAIKVLPNFVETTYTATSPTIIQNKTYHDVEFQTDNTKKEWGLLAFGDTLEIKNAATVIFRSKMGARLAEVRFV
jgi:hypothetical protein